MRTAKAGEKSTRPAIQAFCAANSSARLQPVEKPPSQTSAPGRPVRAASAVRSRRRISDCSLTTRRQSSAVGLTMSSGRVPQPGSSTVRARIPACASRGATSVKLQGESPRPWMRRIPRSGSAVGIASGSGRVSEGALRSSSSARFAVTKWRRFAIHSRVSRTYASNESCPRGWTSAVKEASAASAASVEAQPERQSPAGSALTASAPAPAARSRRRVNRMGVREFFSIPPR